MTDVEAFTDNMESAMIFWLKDLNGKHDEEVKRACASAHIFYGRTKALRGVYPHHFRRVSGDAGAPPPHAPPQDE